jgi:signal transduction histidine kinase
LSQKAIVPERDERLAEALRARRAAILKTARGEAIDEALTALVQALPGGRPELLLRLCPEPVDSARLVGAAARAAMPVLWLEPDGLELAGALLEVVTEVGLAAAEAHRLRAEGRARELNDVMELKTAFLRLATHELRRPVSTARGYLELIQTETFGDVPEALRRPLELIAASNQEIARLVNGLSTVARLEDRADALDLREAPLAVVVEEAVASIRPAAELDDIELRCDLDPALMARVDRERMTAVVLNLLANAVKYSPPGSPVDVVLRRSGRRAEIVVADRGPGVTPGDEERIFEPYFRSERSRSSGVGGLGLGLYIVRHVTDLHGGRVTLSNRPGEGATFRISLSLARGAGTASRPQPQPLVSERGAGSPAARG